MRQVPAQFSWIDHALVQRHLIDRCDARTAALYLFLVTVSNAQGLSYYGSTSLMQRLHLSREELGTARLQLIELDLIAYQVPLYQVLSLSAPTAAAAASASPAASSSSSPSPRHTSGPLSVAQLLGHLEQRRHGRL